MSTTLLYSSIWPLEVEEDQEIISERFLRELEKADELKISVAYFAQESLRQLDKLVRERNIKRVSLVLGMYGKDNFPEESYKLALEINEEWQKNGIGEIRMTKYWKYHGKKYCFLKDNQIFSAITGSPNLSFLHTRQYPQYEEAVLLKDPRNLQTSLKQINQLLSSQVSENITTSWRIPSKIKMKFFGESADHF